MPRPSLYALIVLLVCLVAPAFAGDQDVPSREAALRLLDRDRFDAAVAAFQRIADAHPESALAWFDLAQAHHRSGDYTSAHQAGLRAAEFEEFRATSLYNLACASALQGHDDVASDELDRALAAGFLDYDLLAVDGDLERLRAAGRIELPPRHDYELLKRNRVEISYRLLLPDGYDPERTYPAAVVFSPGGMGTRSTDWTLQSIWAKPDARADWIVVLAALPSNGWINHPSHHALNALMSHVRKRHNVEQNRFHFIGLGAGGRPAATYSGMSRKFARSVVLVDSLAFARWDDDNVAELADEKLSLTLVVGPGEGPAEAEARRVSRLVRDAGGSVTVEIVETDGPILHAVHGGTLLALLADE